MLEGGCCTAVFWTVYPYHRSHCMGSRVAKGPSYPPLHEYKHIVNTHKLIDTFRKESRTFTELLSLPSEYSHLSYYYLDFQCWI